MHKYVKPSQKSMVALHILIWKGWDTVLMDIFSHACHSLILKKGNSCNFHFTFLLQ